MTLKDLIKKLQLTMNAAGEKLAEDGDPGPKTQAALAKYDVTFVVTPKPQAAPVPVGDAPEWYNKAKSYTGTKETDSRFQEYMNAFWVKIGLPQFKGLMGSARAWCALFTFMCLVAGGGYQTGKLNASAISGDNVGNKIDWKVNGIPRGAIVRINHGANCTTSSSNHIGFADGNCAPEDILKAGAKFNMLGGNQGDMVKVSSFPVAHICSVSWPKADKDGKPLALPGKVLKSDHCSGAPTPANESTR